MAYPPLFGGFLTNPCGNLFDSRIFQTQLEFFVDTAQFLVEFARNGRGKSLDGEDTGLLKGRDPFGGYT